MANPFVTDIVFVDIQQQVYVFLDSINLNLVLMGSSVLPFEF